MNAFENPTGTGRGPSLQRALFHTGITVIYCDLNLRVGWAENVPPSWSSASIVGMITNEFLPAEMSARLVQAKQKAIATALSQRIEISVPAPGGASWFSVWVDCDRSEAGDLSGVVTTVVDITEQKRREQTLRTLLREVSHRSKNLLAIIQSIATQTGRHAVSIDKFLLRFRGRLQSLASTQDLVTSSNWRGANLDELVAGQLSRYVSNPERAVHLIGQRPYLNPNAALHIGLALHELTVNSVSYGALSKPNGRVSLEISPDQDGDADGLVLEWSEQVDRLEQEIGQKRFGSTALEKVVPASLNGSASLDIAGDRLTYRLVIPPGNFEID